MISHLLHCRWKWKILDHVAHAICFRSHPSRRLFQLLRNASANYCHRNRPNTFSQFSEAFPLYLADDSLRHSSNAFSGHCIRTDGTFVCTAFLFPLAQHGNMQRLKTVHGGILLPAYIITRRATASRHAFILEKLATIFWRELSPPAPFQEVLELCNTMPSMML